MARKSIITKIMMRLGVFTRFFLAFTEYYCRIII